MIGVDYRYSGIVAACFFTAYLAMAVPETRKPEAYVTLVTNDGYSFGALVLSQSLRRVCTTRQLVVMFTPEVSQEMRDQLLYAFDLMVQVDVLDSHDTVNLQLLTRPDLGVTFTKLHCWRLIQFEKCVFLDADTMVIQNVDELFEREEFSAAPDVGWPDCFNSGVFVFRPSEETYVSLLQHAFMHGSFDGGDQGLLNSYFSSWSTDDIQRHLPFTYNLVAHSFYSYLPAMKMFGQNIKIVHFVGPNKPWTLGYNRATGEVEGHSSYVTEFVYRWWNIFMEHIHYRLPTSLSSKANVFERQPPQVFETHQPTNSVSTVSQEHQMMAPYVPPQVTIFYDPQPHLSDVHEVVMTRERDSFFHFESFYSEPPMTDGESHPYADEMYHASDFNNALTAFTNSSTLPSDLASMGNLESTASVETPPELSSLGEASDKKDGPESQSDAGPVTSAEETCPTSSKVQLSVAESEEGTAEMTSAEMTSAEVQRSATAEVQSMAISKNSNLKMYTKQQLNDLERQFNWERGQIDYLGIDSFDNILKQLEETIKEPLLTSLPVPPPSSAAKGAATIKQPVQSEVASRGVRLPASESDNIIFIPLEE